jgi:hypothetical protein
MILFAFTVLLTATVLLELDRTRHPFLRRARGGQQPAVAAPVLVLRPSGSVHHVPAGQRDHFDDRAGVRRRPVVGYV